MENYETLVNQVKALSQEQQDYLWHRLQDQQLLDSTALIEGLQAFYSGDVIDL